MSYAVKEIFLTLQGEGAHAGRAAVCCRFAGCNLWGGREQDRGTATCRFCDTDFVGTDGTLGGRYGSADELADIIAGQWAGDDTNRYVVLTGGEPLLQVDTPFIDALHARGFAIGIETNGTIDPPKGLDWLCVSPKAASTSSASRCSRWTGRTRSRTPRARSIIACAIRNGGSACRRIRHSASDRTLLFKMWELTKSFRFEAAHSLKGTTFGAASEEIHGHSFRAEVSIRGTPDPATGMVLDLGLVERSMEEVRK